MPNTMNWDDAKIAMANGSKVKNKYFTNDEFFEMKNNCIYCERGYDMSSWVRGESWQYVGWSIIEDNTNDSQN